MISKPTKKSVSIRLAADELKRFSDAYGTSTAGITHAAQYFFSLRDKSLREISNVFTENELQGITKSLTKVVTRNFYIEKANLSSYLEEEEKLYGLSKACNLSFDDLKRKITGLTSAQAYFLIDRVFEYIRNSEPFEKLVGDLTLPEVIK
ncbi:MAG: hypothetical protein LBO71_00490 [Prevotellaceae bacterium]|jgi:hypothetical protein|nr:hypothetical protein [Prevotellaceae bacterium]